MTHDEVRSLLAFRDELAPEHEAELTEHLAECAECRAIADEYRRQDAFLRSLELPEPAADLRPGVFTRLDRPRPVWRRAVPLLSLVPLGALFILITILIHPPRQANAPLSSAPPVRSPGAQKNAPLSVVTPHAAQEPARSRKDIAAPAKLHSHGPRHSAQVVAGGLMLSISVDRLSYPRNALVPVTVRLQNVSGHPIATYPWGYECRLALAWPEVSSASGRVVFPPAYPGERSGAFCPLLAPRAIKSGAALSYRILVVLRGPEIRGVVGKPCVDANTCARARRGKSQLLTPLLRIHLQEPAPPRLTFHPSPRLQAAIRSAPARALGPLYVLESWNCPASTPDGSGYLTWRRVSGSRLRPECAHPTWWRGVAGWLNHSVVTFSYRRKG